MASNGGAHITGVFGSPLALVCCVLCGILLLILGQPTVQASTIQGTWEFAMAVDANSITIQPTGDISIQLIGDTFDVTTKSVFKADGLDSQEFTGNLSLGAIQASSTLLFDASLASFSKFEITLNFQALDISWSAKAHVAPTASNNSLEITGNTDLSWARWSANVVMKSCPSTFDSAQIKLQDISFCASTLYMDLRFSKQGFDSLQLSTSGLAIPGIPMLSTSLKLRLQPSQQELSASFSLVPSQSDACVEVSWKVLTGETSGTSITGIEPSAIDALFNVGDVRLHILHTSVWDLLELSSEFPPICDMTGNWKIQTYFQDHTGMLFGFHRLLFNVTFPLVENCEFVTQIALSDTISFKLTLKGSLPL